MSMTRPTARQKAAFAAVLIFAALFGVAFYAGIAWLVFG